jgi:hypothetical protein
MDMLESAPEQPWQRNAMMIGAHAVWGVTTGLVVAALERAAPGRQWGGVIFPRQPGQTSGEACAAVAHTHQAKAEGVGRTREPSGEQWSRPTSRFTRKLVPIGPRSGVPPPVFSANAG